MLTRGRYAAGTMDTPTSTGPWSRTAVHNLDMLELTDGFGDEENAPVNFQGLFCATPCPRAASVVKATKRHTTATPGNVRCPTAVKKWRIVTLRVWHGMVLERWTNPNTRVVRAALGTGYNRVEGNRRASRNGRVSSSPTRILKVTIRNFFIAACRAG